MASVSERGTVKVYLIDEDRSRFRARFSDVIRLVRSPSEADVIHCNSVLKFFEDSWLQVLQKSRAAVSYFDRSPLSVLEDCPNAFLSMRNWFNVSQSSEDAEVFSAVGLESYGWVEKPLSVETSQDDVLMSQWNKIYLRVAETLHSEGAVTEGSFSGWEDTAKVDQKRKGFSFKKLFGREPKSMSHPSQSFERGVTLWGGSSDQADLKGVLEKNGFWVQNKPQYRSDFHIILSEDFDLELAKATMQSQEKSPRVIQRASGFEDERHFDFNRRFATTSFYTSLAAWERDKANGRVAANPCLEKSDSKPRMKRMLQEMGVRL